MATQPKDAKSEKELGELYCDRSDFTKATPALESAAMSFFAEQDYEGYLSCLNLLLRIYAEQDFAEKITETKEKLQDLVLKEGFELNAKTYYTLGICATYKCQYDVSLDYFQKALTLSLANDSKEDMSFAIYGLAQTYYWIGKCEEGLKEIYNLQVFFEVLDNTRLKLSTQILNGFIHQKMGRYTQALEIFWKAYEMLRAEKNLFMYLHILYALGTTYQKSGDLDLARVYLMLAQKSIDPNNMKVLSKEIEKGLEELGVKSHEGYDLVFENNTNAVVEKRKGRIDFRNQFILLDLLHLLVKDPGEVQSKENIVKRVWSQRYDPSVHDNKIYVTIKRLRKMIEPDYDKPRYIFRAKNGYYLNKSVRVFYDA